MKKEIVITFDDSAKEYILELLGKTLDDEGYIVEKNDPTVRVLSPDGEEIHISEFGGVMKGSEMFIKDDIVSLMRLKDRGLI